MNPVQQILILGVRFYRWILSPIKSAVLGPASHCRFEPSCSAYALEALCVHGACKGSWLAARRLCRCHPWGKFGPDPVPARTNQPAKVAMHNTQHAIHSTQYASRITHHASRMPRIRPINAGS